jgi:hexosaminidase
MKPSAKLLHPMLWGATLSACLGAPMIDVPSGKHENVVASAAGGDAGAHLRLAGDAEFGWLSDGLTGVIDLNGHTLTWDTGGGNLRTCNAAIVGAGNLVWVGGGSHEATLNAPGWIGGTSPNTFSGTLTLQRGTLALNKPPGVDVFRGPRLVAGEGSSNPAIIRWCNNDQIPDSTGLVLAGGHVVRLRLDGHRETLGALSLGTDAEIHLGDGTAVIQFANSASAPWTAAKQMIVHQWDGTMKGGGAEQVRFGDSADGLTPAQLAQVGFMNPAGMPAGLYRARILASGEIVPAETRVEPVNPPFPVDPGAVEARRADYASHGLKALAAAVQAGTSPKRIAFFGDSITWQANGAGDPPETANPANNFEDSHHYVDQIGRAMTRSGTAEVAIFNHGLNGGGVREAESGTEHTGNAAGRIYQPPFAELVKNNRAEVAVVYLGVNDAWWRETPDGAFTEALRNIVASAAKNGCKVVLATPLCIGELPDGTNPHDPALDRIAAAVRELAAATGATLVDLRAAFAAWSRNHNGTLKLDGSLEFMKQDLLTYDGVHLTESGAILVANLIADGILRAAGTAAAEPPPPSPAVPLGLVPIPKSITLGEGAMALEPAARIIVAEASLDPLAAILAEEIRVLTGLQLRAARPPARRGDIVLQLDPAMKGEAYALAVAETAAIKAGNYPALAAGTTTLVQLLRAANGKTTLPRLRIDDDPDYPYRAAMIDLGRKYHTIAGIEQVIRLCRLYKLRYLHLHLTDDQLFMFPSQRFPKAGTSNSEFARFEPPSMPAIKPYTREELVELDRFAARHGVQLIPEIDLPGHSGRLIADHRETFGFTGNGSTVHIANPRTLEAVAELLNEVMDVFTSSPFVHLGADEVNLGGLDQTPEYQEALRRDPQLKSPHDLYCKFIRHMHEVVSRRGRTAIVWEEAWTTKGPYPLPQDVVVMVWNQGRNPSDIVASGHRIINTTWTPLYLVRDNKKSPAFLFDWNPTLFGWEGTEKFSRLSDPSLLLGAQLTSWENSEAIEIQGLRERAAIVAERCWNKQAGGSFADFRTRWHKTDAILDRLVHPLELQTDGEFTTDEHTFRGSLTLRLVPRETGHRIRYTLDNSLPHAGWLEYREPLEIRQEGHLRAGLFDPNGKQIGPLVGAWFRPEP